MDWKFFPCYLDRSRTSPSIKAGYLENIGVLPYVKGRLVFAQLAARVLQGGAFDEVVIDLPQFMNEPGWMEVPLVIFPHLSSIIIKRDDGRHVLIPLVPSDAGYLSLYLAQQNGLPHSCIDDSTVLNYPEGTLFAPRVQLQDDYYVMIEGLEEYCNRVWRCCEQQWEDASAAQRVFTQYRAQVVAHRLREHARGGKRVLFMCEAVLWWGVSKVLQGEWLSTAVPFIPRWQDKDAAVVVEDPYVLWGRGMADDYPALTYRFCEELQKGETKGFDKLGALNEAVGDFFAEKIEAGRGEITVRNLLVFQRYVRNRLVAGLRTMPMPTQLFEDVESCFGRQVARDLAAHLLKYPAFEHSNLRDTFSFFTISIDRFSLGGMPFAIPYIQEAASFHGNYFSDDSTERLTWVAQVHPYITRKEYQEMEDVDSGYWAIQEDYSIYAHACSYIRAYLKNDAGRNIVQKSWGSMGDGIHWEATIDARAQGHKYFFVHRALFTNQHISLDEYTPVVFLFSEDSDDYLASVVQSGNDTHRKVQFNEPVLQNDPRPDKVYTIFKTMEKLIYFEKGHIKKDLLASIGWLYTGEKMEVERYQAIMEKPEQYQCRIDPMLDRELNGFSQNEKLVAWAIKYAEREVIIVPYQGWCPSINLSQFAEEHNVNIINVPLNTLPQALTERLQYLHFISAAVRKHPDRDTIIRRFIG